MRNSYVQHECVCIYEALSTAKINLVCLFIEIWCS